MVAEPEKTMAKAKGERGDEFTSIRILKRSVELARIAAGYTGESIQEYCSRIIAERAETDAIEGHKRAFPEKKGDKP